MASLYRTVPFTQVDHIAIGVRQDLDLDVLRVLHVLLDIHGIIAEGLPGLKLGSQEHLLELLLAVRYPHALSAAAKGCLYHDGIAYLLCDALSVSGRVYRLLCAGDDGNSCLLHGVAGLGFVAHLCYDGGRGSYELYSAGLAELRKFLIFRKEAVARMYGLGLYRHCSGDDGLHIEVAVLGGGRSYAYRLIGQHDMKTVLISSGIDRHGGYAHLPQCPYDTYRYLSSVCNKYFFKHLIPP